MTKITVEELNELINQLRDLKHEIFIEVDKAKLIKAYKANPDELLKVLKNVKPYIPVKEINTKLTKKYDTKLITFILNYVEL